MALVMTGANPAELFDGTLAYDLNNPGEGLEVRRLADPEPSRPTFLYLAGAAEARAGFDMAMAARGALHLPSPAVPMLEAACALRITPESPEESAVLVSWLDDQGTAWGMVALASDTPTLEAARRRAAAREALA